MKVDFLSLTIMALAVSCIEKEKKEDETIALPDSPVISDSIEAGTSETGLLDVTVTFEAEVMILGISGQPEGTEAYSCSLDNVDFQPCHPQANLAPPPPGDHVLTVKSLAQGNVTAVGETVFSVEDKKPNTEAPPSLEVYITKPDLEDGGTWNMTQDLTLEFDLKTAAKCDSEVKFQCKYDSRSSVFWTPCGSKNFVVRKEIMARGLQYFAVQAVCGEELGPVLSHSWYGVPADYQPLMIDGVKDVNNRYLLSLVKANDCPISRQVFECSKEESAPFLPCENGNVLDAPPAGTRVRLACGDLNGPIYSIK